jgi:hypothetical protein
MLTTLTFIGVITTVILNAYQIYIQRKAMAKTVKDIVKKI